MQAYIQHPKRISQPFTYLTEDVVNPYRNVIIVLPVDSRSGLDLVIERFNLSDLLFSLAGGILDDVAANSQYQTKI